MIDRNWSCIDLQAKTNMEAGKCSFSALNWLRNAIKWPNSHNYDTPIPPVVLCLPFNALRWRTSCMVVWFEFLVTNTFIIWNVRWAMNTWSKVCYVTGKQSGCLNFIPRFTTFVQREKSVHQHSVLVRTGLHPSLWPYGTTHSLFLQIITSLIK